MSLSLFCQANKVMKSISTDIVKPTDVTFVFVYSPLVCTFAEPRLKRAEPVHPLSTAAEGLQPRMGPLHYPPLHHVVGQPNTHKQVTLTYCGDNKYCAHIRRTAHSPKTETKPLKCCRCLVWTELDFDVCSSHEPLLRLYQELIGRQSAAYTPYFQYLLIVYRLFVDEMPPKNKKWKLMKAIFTV